MSSVYGKRSLASLPLPGAPHLTVMGCERRVFILAATFGAATFNVLNSLPAACCSL